VRVLLGKRSWLEKELSLGTDETPGDLSEVIGVRGQSAQVFQLEDALRPGVDSLLGHLAARGLQIHVATGDTRKAAESFLRRLPASGITLHAECMPEDKKQLVSALQGNGRRVLMLGDGVNDAPSLACAHVGVAASGGVDVALAVADISLRTPDACTLEALFRFAEHTRQTLTWVIGTSIAYNLAAVSLAVSGIVHPLAAALIMPLAGLSALVICSLRTGENQWTSCSSSSPSRSLSPARP
jgi:Cu2+-exporting ATPase